MRALFSPAIALLNRMGYTKKFMLLWMVSLVAIAVVTYSLFASLDKVIQPSQRQLQGLALIEPISRTVQFIQQHRGISAVLLSGNRNMEDWREGRRTATERQATEAFQAMEKVLPPGLTSNKDFRHIKADWEQLRKQGLHWTVAENFAAHTSLIEQIQLFEVFVADEYLLTLDTELASSYLIDTATIELPHALEHLGQIRAYGTGILAGKQITEPQKVELNVMMGELGHTLKSLNLHLEKAGRYNPALQKPLLAVRDGIADSARQITGLVASDILTDHFATPPDVFLDMVTAEMDKSYTQMYQTLLPTAKTLIEARIAQAKNTLLKSVGGALLLFLLVVYISISIYYAIIGSIQSLIHSAHTFAGGNLSERVKLSTRDELSQVGDSFNEMADGLSVLLETHREDEARMRAIIESSLDAVVRMDDAGTIIGWSTQAEKIFGWSGEEAVGRVLSETIIPPQYREAHVNGLKRFLLSGEGPVLNLRIEVTGLHRDGHEFPVELAIAPIRAADKYEFNGFIHDITGRKQAEEKLQVARQHEAESLSELRVMLNTSGEGFWKVDQSGCIVETNDAYCHIIGYARDEIAGAHISKFEAIERTPEAVTAHMQHIIEKGYDHFETRHRHRDGHLVDIEVTASFIAETNCFIVFLRDVTERKRTEEALRIAAIAFETQAAMVVTDTTPKILRVNQAFEEITGYTAAEAIGHNPNMLSAPELRKSKAFYEEMWADLLSKGKWGGEVLDKRKDGEIYPKWLTITAVAAPDGTTTHYIGSFFNITERKKAEEEINRLAFYDLLTNLPNRRLFYDRLEQDIKKAHRADLKMVLLFIDLDKFKEVNDTLGHGMGDLLLVEAARRISDCVRETDTVARLGGDEFTVILAELDDIGIAERVAEDILRKLAEPFRLVDEVAHVSASIGITLYPDDATGTEDLLKNADQAMYTAKGKGRNRFSYFTQSMQQAAQTKLRLINELRGALAANQFVVYYQPVVELATGRINKAEALIRWQHPELGMVSPAQFIPLAEETGLIVEIGDWVFREAAHQLQHWRALHNTELQISVNVSPMQCSELQISVNVSPVQFRVTSPYRTWSAYLQELGLPGGSMVIEITEGLLLEADVGVTGKLLEFHDVGIQVAIDDFGTGYSSLSYLKKFDIDYLKIDQSFVRNLAEDSNDLALSEAIIVMAHKLGLKVIAEGVETEAQCKLLADAGCDYAQGYLFSRPVPAGEFEELLKSGRPLCPKCCS